MSESIKYKEYEYLCAKIAWWLLNNNKSFRKRDSYNGIKREDLEAQIIKGQGKIQNNNIAEYVECAVEDNTPDLDFLPNYVVSPSGKKHDKSIYVDMCRRVAKYEVENRKSPNIVYLKDPNVSTVQAGSCNSPYTQSPILTGTGPGGMGQKTSYSCGANCLQQAFYNLTGKLVDESVIMGWAGTTTAGTSHSGLNTAVAAFNRAYGTGLKVEWKNLSDFGDTMQEQFRNVSKLSCEGKFVFFHLLYRNRWGHYETWKTLNADSRVFQILNSLGTKCGSSGYYGYVESRSEAVQKQYASGISQPSVCIIHK